MKKTLLYLATFAAAVSCDLYGGQETPKTADKPGSITISFSEVKDSSFVVNIAPTAEASYYSYLIDEDVEAAELDSSKLYKVAYTSLEQGSVKWTAEDPSKTIKMDNLMPNTTYQVYAVAGSPMGYVGSVVVASVTTSDGVNPFPVNYTSQDSTLTVTFSEPVKVGKGKFSASFYAFNSENIATGVPEGHVAESDIVVEAKGNSASITVNNLPDGAFYTVTYEDGAFEDYTGNKVKGLKSSMVLNADTNYKPVYKGLGGRNAVGTFKLGALSEEDSIYATETPAFLIEFGSKYGYGWTDDEKNGSAVYAIGNKTTNYVLTANADFGYLAVRKK
ncbi:MAG: Ig-like domain-containing protein, partial [Candidatus Cryptobacteroides sp.]